MAELTLLLPPLSKALDADEPFTLSRWLRLGDRMPAASPGRDPMLRECFEFTGTDVPAAALTRSLHSADVAGALWLRADPAWVVADAVTARLLACGNMELSQADSDTLARALKPLFGDAGFPLEPATPSHWYLRVAPGAQLPRFSPPEAALGDDLARHMPEGSLARRWGHLLNEAQMILHSHPINAERAQRGLAPVNSVWFWGAGELPQWVRTGFTRVLSADEIVSALAKIAKVAVEAPAPELLSDLPAEQNLLVDLGTQRDPVALDRNWLRPIQAAVERRAIAQVLLLFASGERHRYRHAHRWRFWRNLRSRKP